ncbi:MAG: DUF4242 domain-containing protein [Candidatus Marinimicrobia bacterium]|nr:DUF4242 domain-containing protein [FCB group bacterium]MBL7028232.1 DUF4242 domain-containing protein [Candidatus Neomarinimicrobiota bacterium]
MPIYMDRHYMEGATRHTVEKAHQLDLEIQDEYGVEIQTYWFDEKRGTAFCLIDAPDQESVVHVHGAAHGSIPHEIIEVDPTVVQAFLGNIKDPISAEAQEKHATAPKDSPFRTIMFTDLMDSTATTTRLGDDKAMFLLRVHNALTRNAIRQHSGREIKHTGDGFMVSFINATDAVNCAISIQQAFAGYNEDSPDETLHVRIGLSAGEPVQEDGDFFGTTVQLAARLCDFAQPDKIIIARIVHDLCPEDEFSINRLEGVKPKGFDKPVDMSEVLW